MATADNPFLGWWRIVSAATWRADALDLLGPAFIEFERQNVGFLRLVSIQGDIDYRVAHRADGVFVEWSWDGASDSDRGCGRGWAVLVADELHGHIYLHLSDDSSFVARRDSGGTSAKVAAITKSAG